MVVDEIMVLFKRREMIRASRIIYVFTKKHKCSNLQLRVKKKKTNKREWGKIKKIKVSDKTKIIKFDRF